MKYVLKILFTLFIDILKGLFTSKPIVKPATPSKKPFISEKLSEKVNFPDVDTTHLKETKVEPQVEKEEVKVEKLLVTPEQFTKIFHHGNVAIVPSLNTRLSQYGIDNKERVAMFMAQCGHESCEFTRFSENLNYSAEALRKIFPSRIPDMETANKYARKPEMIGNRVYAGKLGNGDEASGDGYRYRGRGALQTTGKDGYTNFAKYIKKTLEEATAYIQTNDGAIDSAICYWNMNNINPWADKGDVAKVTEIINGRAKLGLAERTAYYKLALEVIAPNFEEKTA